MLCGLRNGAILSIDARQRPENFSSRLPRHQIPYRIHETSSGRAKKFHQERFEVSGLFLVNLSFCNAFTLFLAQYAERKKIFIEL